MVEITHYRVFYYGGLERPKAPASQYQYHRRAIIYLSSDKKVDGKDVQGHISFWDRLDIPNYQDCWAEDDDMVYFDIHLHVDHFRNVLELFRREKSVEISRSAWQNVIQGEQSAVGK